MTPERRPGEEYADFRDTIPDELIDIDRKEDFISWLTVQPIDPQMAKYILMSWCDAVGVALSIDLVDEVTRGQARETRG